MKKEFPMMLSAAIDEVECGAILKHAVDDSRAVIVDFEPQNGTPICVRCKPKWASGEKLPSKPEHYEIFAIRKGKMGEWIALNAGGNELLVP